MVNGFGFTVNHGMKGGAGAAGGQFRPVFVGDHHAIYEYTFEVSAGLPVTLQWLFATGRDHPLLAITYDMTKRTAGIEADTRTPYGDMAWDGDENAATTVVSGVGLGRSLSVRYHVGAALSQQHVGLQHKNLVPLRNGVG